MPSAVVHSVPCGQIVKIGLRAYEDGEVYAVSMKHRPDQEYPNSAHAAEIHSLLTSGSATYDVQPQVTTNHCFTAHGEVYRGVGSSNRASVDKWLYIDVGSGMGQSLRLMSAHTSWLLVQIRTQPGYL